MLAVNVELLALYLFELGARRQEIDNDFFPKAVTLGPMREEEL